MEYDPRPIPESITYTGDNEWQVLDWAHQTWEHYEQPKAFGHEATPGYMRLTDHHAQRTMVCGVGDRFTYVEGLGLNKLGPPDPEILVRDHPSTVAERIHLIAEQSRRGVPVTGNDFTGRRATHVLDAMSRHPSGKYANPAGSTNRRVIPPPHLGL